MTEVIVTKSINIPADKAWENLSSFRGIENISPVERSVTEGHGAGATRTCYLPDGAAIHEILNMVEDQNMEMQYQITQGPFPIQNYISNVKVSTLDQNSCRITWGCTFDCEEAVEKEMIQLFEGFYNVIIESLESLVQSQN